MIIILQWFIETNNSVMVCIDFIDEVRTPNRLLWILRLNIIFFTMWKLNCDSFFMSRTDSSILLFLPNPERLTTFKIIFLRIFRVGLPYDDSFINALWIILNDSRLKRLSRNTYSHLLLIDHKHLSFDDNII